MNSNCWILMINSFFTAQGTFSWQNQKLRHCLALQQQVQHPQHLQGVPRNFSLRRNPEDVYAISFYFVIIFSFT